MRAAERHVRVAGTKILVRDVGEGRPVLLCNGIGAHVEMWQPLERALDGFRIVSFDAPGTGRSPTRLVPLKMGGLARLVEGLLDKLRIQRADVIGYSFGGALAQQLAALAGDRVRRLVLAATFPGWGGVPGHMTAMLSMATPLRYYSRGFYSRTAGAIAGGRARYDQEHVQRLWRDRAAHPPTFSGYWQQLWTVSTWSSLRWLAKIEVPTLIVVGDDDPLVPMSNALMMAARMPNARMFVGQGDGHFLLLDEQSSALSSIRQFLDADPLDEAPVWRSAAKVGRRQAAAQLRVDGIGAFPWGAVSAMIRLWSG